LVSAALGWGAYLAFSQWGVVVEGAQDAWRRAWDRARTISRGSEAKPSSVEGESLPFLGVRLENSTREEKTRQRKAGYFSGMKQRTIAALAAVSERREEADSASKSGDGKKDRPAPGSYSDGQQFATDVMGVIIKSDPQESLAIIGGSVVGVGENIAGAKLVEVRTTGVVLEFRGERRYVTVGGGE